MKTKKKKFIIITGYFSNESYGLLGPQMAATIIEENTPYDCIVVAVTNKYNKADLKNALKKYFSKKETDEQPIVGFSTLGGRVDLFELAKELKQEGAITILAGPQAGVDFQGEIGKNRYPYRFQGFSDHFSFAVQGPAEQIIPFLNAKSSSLDLPGFLFKNRSDKIVAIPAIPYSDKYLEKISWDNLFVLENSSFSPLKVTLAQILQQIGCPHASAAKKIAIDYPEALSQKKQSVKIKVKGCSFCDVAADKGFMGHLKDNSVAKQLKQLPEIENSRKIPFELINETPVIKLAGLIKTAVSLNIKLSQINLTLRADHIINNLEKFKTVLQTAKKQDIKILISSIGFESFANTILNNLNKGIIVEANLDAVKKIRSLAYQFKDTLYYMRNHGANHGFIHPTPWDSSETQKNSNAVIARYNLAHDILPNHSTPLIIHHASALGEWARQIESEQKIKFSRHGSTIGWWEIDGEVVI